MIANGVFLPSKGGWGLFIQRGWEGESRSAFMLDLRSLIARAGEAMHSLTA